MDEPTAPLSLVEVESLFSIVRKARARGTCILYVSHRLDEIFTICDRVTILRDGRYVTTAVTRDLDRDHLVKLMVGRELTNTYPARKPATTEVALELRSLQGNGNEPISFALHRGEILGVAGLVGAGQTELAKVIYGAARQDGGELLVNGRVAHFESPRQAMKAGIGLVPENRKEEGVFLDKPIRWNIAIAALEQLKRKLIVDRKAEANMGQTYQERLRIKTPSSTSL